MPYTGADIPEELFESIVHCAVRPYELLWSQPNADITHELCKYALVSRYFANVCRPCLFRHVSFTSYAKARGFVDLVDAASSTQLPHIGTLLEYFELEPGAEDFPWVHIVTMELLPKLRHSGSAKELFMNLKLKSQLLGLGHGATSHPFPRSLPAACFSPIVRLTLTSIHVEEGEDLLKYLAALPHLAFLDLEDVTWENTPALHTTQRLSSALRQVTSKESAETLDSCIPWFAAAFLGMQSNATRARPRDAVWCPLEQVIFMDTLEALQVPTLVSSDSTVYWKVISFRDHVAVNRWVEAEDQGAMNRSHYLKINIPFPEVLSPHLIPQHPDDALHKHLRRLIATLHSEDWSKLDATFRSVANMWTKIATTAAELRYLTNVVLSFRTTKTLSDFVLTYHEWLFPLNDIRALKYYDKQRSRHINAADVWDVALCPIP